MNYLIEALYLLLALILLLTLSANLTAQILTIYQLEESLRTFTPQINSKTFSESLAYTISRLYIRKYQWIEAIQILQLVFLHKQLYDKLNRYSLFSLCSVIAHIYGKCSKDTVAIYYTSLVQLSNS